MPQTFSVFQYSAICMLGDFLPSAYIFNIFFFKIFIKKYHQIVKLIGYLSGTKCLQRLSADVKKCR